MNLESGEAVSRRTFLTRAVMALGGLIGVALGGGGLLYFISPAFRRTGEDWVDLGPVAEIKPGNPVKIEFTVRKRDAWATIESRSSAWVLTADRRDFIVYDPRCTHLGCPYRWNAEEQRFMCPCHTAVFGKDGQVQSGPAPRPLDRFPVKVVGGRLLIRPQPVRAEAA